MAWLSLLGGPPSLRRRQQVLNTAYRRRRREQSYVILDVLFVAQINAKPQNRNYVQKVVHRPIYVASTFSFACNYLPYDCIQPFQYNM